MGHEFEAGQDSPHISVLLDEVVAALSPLADAYVLDGTFGAGGYSRALLAGGARVVGLDRDPTVQPFADALSNDFPDRFQFIPGRFSDLDTLAPEGVNRVVLDIGVSSMQLDQAERGFSFQRDGALDMRMSADGLSAADLVNTLDEKELADLIFAFGEERKSRRIASAIVRRRVDQKFETTLDLAQLIEKTIGRKPGDIHPATRSFQALRIAVNGELDELVSALFAAERLLPEGGILAVVTFHSLEDRIVKRFFAPEKTMTQASRHLPQTELDWPRWESVVKPVKAGDAEIARNPRARSATLRHAKRTGQPARALNTKGLGLPGFHLRGAA